MEIEQVGNSDRLVLIWYNLVQGGTNAKIYPKTQASTTTLVLVRRL